ncbi:hypothetical protein [Niallia sp. Krafla_26]|uniref:hypothetical protein n=1 Tax=Niallia sp. Krafla_26 TaxID=3064703 RepID=UPI003D16482D
MDQKQRFDLRANEANLKLNERMNEGNNNTNQIEGHSVTDTNMKLDEAFYGEDKHDNTVPTYVTTETAAIKITGGEE